MSERTDRTVAWFLRCMALYGLGIAVAMFVAGIVQGAPWFAFLLLGIGAYTFIALAASTFERSP